MKISEVIAELEKIQKNFGDLPMVVARYDNGRYGWEEVGEVTLDHHYYQHSLDGGSYYDHSVTLTR